MPQPLDTSNIKLPSEINKIAEFVAENCHEASVGAKHRLCTLMMSCFNLACPRFFHTQIWAIGRIEQGWRWGEQRDNVNKRHPDLIPYPDLPDATKQYDRDTANQTLKVQQLGDTPLSSVD